MAPYQQKTFNGGEAAEAVWSRDDIASATKCVRLGKNGVFMVQGGWRRRKGTWYVADGRNAATADCELMPFTRAAGQSVMIEINAGYARVYGLDRARVGTVEFAVPFSQDELNGGLSAAQSGDALIIYRRNHKQPHVIQRLGPETWQCVPYVEASGPLLTAYSGDGPSLMVDGPLVSCDDTIFTEAHVGALIRIKPPGGFSQADGWRADWNKPLAGEVVYYAGNYYSTTNPSDKKTGYLAPVHESGTKLDGNGGTSEWGVPWSFLHDGSTWGRISGFVDTSHVYVAWLSTQCVADGETTGYWSEGAYSDHRGYPAMAPCFHNGRLVTGGTKFNPGTLDLTRVNGWTINGADYKPGMGSGLVVPDDAVRPTVGGDDAALKWAVDHEVLLVATTRGIYSVTGGAYDSPISASARKVTRLPEGVGSGDVLPAKTPSGLLYVALAGGALVELSGSQGDYGVDNSLGLLFEHITDRKIVQVLFMEHPWNLIVLRLADGGVAFVGYDRKQNVVAASQQDFGGRVFSIATVDGPDGVAQLWLGIERFGKRRICVMAAPEERMFLDLASFYEGSEAISVIDGLDYLEGEVIEAVADGQWHKGLSVTGGEITLNDERTASYIVAGLGFEPELQFMPLGEGRRAWADMRANPERGDIVMRATAAIVNTTDGDAGSEGRPEKLINRAANGAWIEKRWTMAVNLNGTTAYDKLVTIKGHGPFELIVYSCNIYVSGK